jgi:hypothetical protein
MAVDEPITNDEAAGVTGEGPTPPYIPWATFTGLLSRMETTVVPTKIDYSFLSNYAGGERPKIVQALRYLGLVERDSYKATDDLKELVAKKDERPRLYRKLLETYYPWALNLPTNATEQDLLDGFRDNGGVEGDTRRKAVTFFLNAADAAQVEVSQLWRRGRGRPAGTRSRAKRRTFVKPEIQTPGPPSEPESSSEGDVITVNLKAGGTLTLRVNVSHVALSRNKTDREFVQGVIDKLTAYDPTDSQTKETQ